MSLIALLIIILAPIIVFGAAWVITEYDEKKDGRKAPDYI